MSSDRNVDMAVALSPRGERIAGLRAAIRPLRHQHANSEFALGDLLGVEGES